MKISPIVPYNKNFCSTIKTKYVRPNGETYLSDEFSFCKPNAKLQYSHTTEFFRDDLSWNKIGANIEHEFKYANKAEIHNLACSDGSEPYSLAICIIEHFGEEKAKNFFPIHASDIDEKIIETAKSGKIFATFDDIQKIKSISNNNLERYFNIEKIIDGNYLLETKSILKNAVEFQCADAAKSLDRINNNNTLILCRNFWRYLSSDKIIELTKKLQDKMSYNSRLIIGSFDATPIGIPFFLKEYGINCINYTNNSHYILRKTKNTRLNRYQEDILKERIERLYSYNKIDN